MAKKSENNGNDATATDERVEQTQVKDQASFALTLERLAQACKDFDDTQSAPKLSHYRQLPLIITQTHDILQQGAALVYNSSTKYALLGGLDANEQLSVSQDLLQGCQLVATAGMLLCQDENGTSRSLRRAVKQAVRAIIGTVHQLVVTFATGEALQTENLSAQKTGAVWAACNVILEKKLPVGNRNAMRRDLLTFVMQCNETMTEFQELVDAGANENDDNDNNDDNDDEGYDEFGDDQYTSKELSVAILCIAIIKCSRGALNASLQACEAAGAQINNDNTRDAALLSWISALHDKAREVGEGVTNLGVTLYPPLEIDVVKEQVTSQVESIQAVLACISDATPNDSTVIELTPEVNDLIQKLQNAIQNRHTEVTEAIERCNK